MTTKHSKPNKLQKQQKIEIDNRSGAHSPNVLPPDEEEDEEDCPTPKKYAHQKESFPKIATRPEKLLSNVKDLPSVPATLSRKVESILQKEQPDLYKSESESMHKLIKELNEQAMTILYAQT